MADERPSPEEVALIREAGELPAMDLAIATDNVRWAFFRAPRGVATLGRYVALTRIGEGGTGLVYDAYDPLLERRVALKLLQPRGEDPEGAARGLLANARGMAKLRHPNAVSILDAGLTGGDVAGNPVSVYVVMEKIDGVRLDRWLSDHRRKDRDILRVFIEAGSALAGAHAMDLVHRDFKPQNVLLRKDGSPVVIDFAVLPSEETTVAPLELGTPGYMAPEQAESGHGSPAADQYSFCACLARAFGGRQGGETLETETLVVRGYNGPRWLKPVLKRGLSRSPEDRHPDMANLLTRLRRARLRRSLWVGAIALGALGLGAGLWINRGDAASDACLAHASAVEQAWTHEARGQMEERFLGAGLSETWKLLGPRLDEWLGRWVHRVNEDCTEALAKGRAPRAGGGPTDSCLEHERRQFRAFLEVLEHADTSMMAHSPRVAALLFESPSDCQPIAEASSEELMALERGLIRAAIYGELGAHDRAIDIADAALQGALLANDDHAAARARLSIARILIDREQDAPRVERTLREVIAYSEAADLPRLRLSAFAIELDLHANRARRERAEEVFSVATAILERDDVSSPMTWARLNLGLARARLKAGDLEATARALDEARDGWPSTRPTSNPTLLEVRIVRAQLLKQEGKLDEAATEYRRALAEAFSLGGSQYPALTEIELGLVAILIELEREDEAELMLQTSAERSKALGLEDKPVYGRLLQEFGIIAGLRQDYDAARGFMERAATILAENYGEQHLAVVKLRSNLAIVDAMSEDPPTRDAGLARLMTMGDLALSAPAGTGYEPGTRIDLRLAAAHVLRTHGRFEDSLRYAEGLTREIKERRGADSREVSTAMVIEAEGLWRAGRRQRAVEVAQLAGTGFDEVHDLYFDEGVLFLALLKFGEGPQFEAKLREVMAKQPDEATRAALREYISALRK